MTFTKKAGLLVTAAAAVALSVQSPGAAPANDMPPAPDTNACEMLNGTSQYAACKSALAKAFEARRMYSNGKQIPGDYAKIGWTIDCRQVKDSIAFIGCQNIRRSIEDNAQGLYHKQVTEEVAGIVENVRRVSLDNEKTSLQVKKVSLCSKIARADAPANIFNEKAYNQCIDDMGLPESNKVKITVQQEPALTPDQQNVRSESGIIEKCEAQHADNIRARMACVKQGFSQLTR